MNAVYYNGEEKLLEDSVYQEWLEYFYVNADFGPADDDVRQYMFEQFLDDVGINHE